MNVGASSQSEPETYRARKILLAEDNVITNDLLKLLLIQRGHQIDVVTDGERALEALRRNHYDVALLDFHLPKMDGLQVAASIRNESRGRPLPRLVIITADVEGLLAYPDGSDNFDDVMPKPLDIHQVAELVESARRDWRSRGNVPAGPGQTNGPKRDS